MPRHYEFKSKSNPDAEPHVVTVEDDGYTWCTCRGFLTPNKCWHVRDVKNRPLEQTPMNWRDRFDVHKLLVEGNVKGAGELIKDLFPSMSLEEMAQLLDEIALDETTMEDPC